MRKNLPLFLPLMICLGVIFISQTGCRFTGPPYKTSSWHFYNPFSDKSKSNDEDELAKKIDDMPSYASTLPKAEVSTPRDGYSSSDRSSVAGSQKSSSAKIAKSDIKYDSKINSDPLANLPQTSKTANLTYGTTSPVNGTTPVTSTGASYVASNTTNTVAPTAAPATAFPTAQYGYSPNGYSPAGADQNQFAQNQFQPTVPQSPGMGQTSGMGMQTGDSIGSTNGAMPDPNMMMAGIPATPQNNGVFSTQNGGTPNNGLPQQAVNNIANNTMPQTVAQQTSVPGNYPAAGNYPAGMQPTDVMNAGNMGTGTPVNANSSVNSGMTSVPTIAMGNPYHAPATDVPISTPGVTVGSAAGVVTSQTQTQGLSPNMTPYNNTYGGNTVTPPNPSAYIQQPASTYNGGFSSFAPAANDGYRPGGY